MDLSAEHESTIYTFPARVQRIQDAEQRNVLMERLQAIVLDEAILEEHPPFFGNAEISNSLVDSYFSHMDESSLRNYADDAARGVAFQNSHKRMELPMGRSLSGSYQAGEPARVLSDFYMLGGLNLNGINTDDVIRGIRGGIVTDISIGFGGGYTRCDLCQNEYFSWDCPHLAGLRYETKDGDVVRQELATYGIYDAHLHEFSAVYDGATPGASILKASRMIQDGRVGPDEIRKLEAQYRTKLPEAKRTFRGADVPKERSKNVEATEQLAQVRSVLGLGEDGDILATLTEATKEVDGLRAKVAELQPLAEDGKQYRSQCVEDALANGIRAFGDKFDAEKKRAFLESQSLETVRTFNEEWERLGDARFTGGRKTTDDAKSRNPDKPQATEQPPARKRVQMPTGAYKV